MNNLTTDTQDEIVRALGDKINYHERWIVYFDKQGEHGLSITESGRLATAKAAWNEIHGLPKPIDPND